MLQALADGETNPTSLAALADKKLRATPAQLCDALSACTELNPVYRRLMKMVLEELQFLEQQIVKLEQEMASLLIEHHEAVQRFAEVPSLGVASAQQIITEEYRLSDRQSTDASDRAVDSRGVLVHTNDRHQHFWRRTCRVHGSGRLGKSSN
jgi:hypothetical protein